MKIKKLIAIFSLAFVMATGLVGCGSSGSSTTTTNTSTNTVNTSTVNNGTDDASSSVAASDIMNIMTSANVDTTTTGAVTTVSDLDFTDMFSDRDSDSSYDEASSNMIMLSDDQITSSGSGITIDGSTVTISEAGTYILSGSLSDGQIIVDAADSDKVQLVLDGVSITNADGPCIYVKNADKVFITLAKDTSNTLSDTGEEYASDGDLTNIDGVIFSKDDITFNGEGSLFITASYANGIVGKDDVVFAGGSYTITATGNAIEGKDSVRVKDGTFILSGGSEKDGIHSSNEEETGKGFVYIEGGTFTISAGDDGIHAETALVIAGGDITVANSYEAIEGDTIDILGGTLNLTASDDGINASSSSSQDEPGFGNGNMGGFMDNDENAYIHIYGGNIYVNAAGDGIDSNGNLIVEGGYVVVEGPENDGNGPLDKGGEALIYGGTVIAVGSSGMAETFASDSTQYSILYGFSDYLSAGTTITLTDSTGKEVMSFTTSKSASSVVFSSADLTTGDYTITAGDFTDTITVSDISTTAGEVHTMSFGPGGGQGGPGGNGGSGGQGGPGNNGGQTPPDGQNPPDAPSPENATDSGSN